MARGTVGRRAASAATVAVVLVLTAASASGQTGYTGAAYFVKTTTAEGERSEAVYLFNSVDVTRGWLRTTVTVPLVVERTRWAVDGVPDVEPEPWTVGFGDPVIRLDVEPFRRGASGLSARFGAAIKAPLASVDEGLSSGEVDVGLGVSVSAGRDRDSVLADVTYWIVGDPPDLPLRNGPSAYVGYARVLDRDYRWSALVSVSGSPALAPGLRAPAQVGIGILRVLRSGAGLGVSVDIGLTDGAADIAVGTSWRMAF
jgi:hypothetical protein